LSYIGFRLVSNHTNIVFFWDIEITLHDVSASSLQALQIKGISRVRALKNAGVRRDTTAEDEKNLHRHTLESSKAIRVRAILGSL
jgi:cobalamin biosynthesis protein CobD/CbiB